MCRTRLSPRLRTMTIERRRPQHELLRLAMNATYDRRGQHRAREVESDRWAREGRGPHGVTVEMNKITGPVRQRMKASKHAAPGTQSQMRTGKTWTKRQPKLAVKRHQRWLRRPYAHLTSMPVGRLEVDMQRSQPPGDLFLRPAR